MKIKDLKRKLKITDSNIANWFGYKNANSYSNSARKHHVENGIIELYKKLKQL